MPRRKAGDPGASVWSFGPPAARGHVERLLVGFPDRARRSGSSGGHGRIENLVDEDESAQARSLLSSNAIAARCGTTAAPILVEGRVFAASAISCRCRAWLGSCHGRDTVRVPASASAAGRAVLAIPIRSAGTGRRHVGRYTRRDHFAREQSTSLRSQRDRTARAAFESRPGDDPRDLPPSRRASRDVSPGRRSVANMRHKARGTVAITCGPACEGIARSVAHGRTSSGSAAAGHRTRQCARRSCDIVASSAKNGNRGHLLEAAASAKRAYRLLSVESRLVETEQVICGREDETPDPEQPARRAVPRVWVSRLGGVERRARSALLRPRNVARICSCPGRAG